MRDQTVHRVESLLRNPLVLIVAGVVLTSPLVVLTIWALPYYRDYLSDPFWFPLIVMFTMLFMILNSTAVCILAERKIAGWTQDRRGPNRVGFWGLLQPIADGIKFFLKEDITPKHVDKPLFYLAPAVSMVIALMGFVIIPWAGDVRWPWMEAHETVSTQAVSINIGFLYLLATGSLGVYGIVLAGYASNNKYSFYGGMRAAAQMISYELPLGIGLICVLLAAGSLRPEVIVEQQATSGIWFVFLQPIAFFLVLVSSFAEANRAPFDLAEAEQELVGGFHTEYSSMKFALFFLAEYAHMIVGSALMVALFFGGWHIWGGPGPEDVTPVAMLIKFGVYIGKVALFIGLFMLIRWTIPRFRFDQLMRIAWQSMVPVGIILVAGIAVLAARGWHDDLVPNLVLNVIVLLILLWNAARSTRPVSGRQTDLPEIQVRPQ